VLGIIASVVLRFAVVSYARIAGATSAPTSPSICVVVVAAVAGRGSFAVQHRRHDDARLRTPVRQRLITMGSILLVVPSSHRSSVSAS
jgi:hypothetical protein